MVIVEDMTARAFVTQDDHGHVHGVTLTGGTRDGNGDYCTCGQRLCVHVDQARAKVQAEIDASMNWSPILSQHPIEVLPDLPVNV